MHCDSDRQTISDDNICMWEITILRLSYILVFEIKAYSYDT